jgi:hypothetical protein
MGGLNNEKDIKSLSTQPDAEGWLGGGNFINFSFCIFGLWEGIEKNF